MASGFGDRLKQLRQRAGMTQEQLAYTARVSLSSVTKAEQGKIEPTWNTVRALAKALGVSLAEFDSVDEPPAANAKPEPAAKKPPQKK